MKPGRPLRRFGRLLGTKKLETRAALTTSAGGFTVRSPLKAEAGLQTRVALKPRSDQMAKLYAEERVPFVTAFLAEYPTCMIGWDADCQWYSVDVHEKLGRGVGGHIIPRGWSAGDPVTAEMTAQFLATCRNCHRAVTQNPAEAHRRGFVVWTTDE